MRTTLWILSAIAWSVGPLCAPMRADEKLSPDHKVPVAKKLDAGWVKSLWAKGGPRVCRGEELKPIGMPCGGIGAGQMYLGGDGRLLHWDIFNEHIFTGYGNRCYRLWEPQAKVAQGFAIRVVRGGKAVVRRLDRTGVKDVRFVGEYPIGTVEYRDAALGVGVTLKAFSPFIPLSAADSGLPATILQFTLRNTGRDAVEATLAGWLGNAVLLPSRQRTVAVSINRVVQGRGLTWLDLSAERAAMQPVAKAPTVFADFEGADYGEWKVEGKAFGKGPARGTLPQQQAVSGYRGKGLVNTYLGGDEPHGKLTSPAFTIRRPYINFLVGGGNQAGKTCINLLVGGKVVRTATGRQNEQLTWHAWGVKDLIGKQAHIEIVDRASGGWGHVNVDQIEFADRPTGSPTDLKELPDFGTMGLALLGPVEGTMSAAAVPAGAVEKAAEALFAADGSPVGRAGIDKTGRFRQDAAQGGAVGALARRVRLAPGQAQQVTFVVAWHFPNHKRGHSYTKHYDSALAVARYVGANLERLAGDTQRWHDTYYDSTLPHWLLDRLHMPVSTLATSTVQWWANGRLWAWEGVGCCAGTCTHVWNYEHAMARLQPELERSARIMQDFGEGYDAATGLVGFRSNRAYAADGQCGTILKAYREHLISPDYAFLKAHWPRIRKAMTFLLKQDGDDDGLITNSQHNTFDINFHGANTFVGALYLAALRASEEMARVMNDRAFADRCRKVFDSGSRKSMQELFDGEYFIQAVDLKKHPRHQYGRGCLADQMFGQNWAHQLALGYVYPPEAVRKALRSVYKYNWAPDVGPQNALHRPERVFARPGEAGLFICTWPKSKHLEGNGVRYRSEVWTGIEYQVAAGLIYEGCIEEALVIIRAVHDRYDAKKRNPWNEVECGDHYARALSSWGCLLGLSGYEYDGPAGKIAFAPRITPADFRCAFTAAEGWGTLAQRRTDRSQTNTITVRWGRLRLAEIGVVLPAALKDADVRLTAAGKAVECELQRDETGRVTLRPRGQILLRAGQSLVVAAGRLKP